MESMATSSYQSDDDDGYKSLEEGHFCEVECQDLVKQYFLPLNSKRIEMVHHTLDELDLVSDVTQIILDYSIDEEGFIVKDSRRLLWYNLFVMYMFIILPGCILWIISYPSSWLSWTTSMTLLIVGILTFVWCSVVLQSFTFHKQGVTRNPFCCCGGKTTSFMMKDIQNWWICDTRDIFHISHQSERTRHYLYFRHDEDFARIETWIAFHKLS